jgi:hypothetical protein
MSTFKQKTTFQKVTKPVPVKEGSEYYKSHVVTQYQVKPKKGDKFNVLLVADIFGKKDKVNKTASKVKENFAKGDEVELTFTARTNSTKKGYFAQIKYYDMQHADKQTDDWDEGGSEIDDWEADEGVDKGGDDDGDLPF